MSTRSKGNRTQLKLIKQLESNGFRVAKLEQKGKFTKQTDAFGLFDLLAIKPDHPPGLIQVTTNRNHPHKPYSDFAKEYAKYFVIQQSIWHDRKGWVHYLYDTEGEKVTFDNRKQ